MRRPPIYSRPAARSPEPAPPASPEGVAVTAVQAAPGRWARWRQAQRQRWVRGRALALRHERMLWALAALGIAWLAAQGGLPGLSAPPPQPHSLEEIEDAMRDAIAKRPLDSAHAAAYEAIAPSVVRVEGEQLAEDDASPRRKPARPALPASHPDIDTRRSLGSGVVIVDNGLILTNLHVVSSASRLFVTFHDGTRSEADVVSRDAALDLAVLRARTIPDDLAAATMRASDGLGPGTEVLAVGYPFGIGPSASAGVISGLKRRFRSEGGLPLTGLIQFDAAANPGNSGGPLITLDGHVVGIVTAILNPTEHATFIGIGFAVPIEAAAAAVGSPPF